MITTQQGALSLIRRYPRSESLTRYASSVKVMMKFLVCLLLFTLLLSSCRKDPDIFNPDLTYGSISDIEKNTYRTINIGDQVWMAENLRTTKYNDGTDIYLSDEKSGWSTQEGAYCWYDHKRSSKAQYGALYNFTAVNTGNLCPVGWHVPDIVEWETLLDYLISAGYNYDGSETDNKIAQSLASTTQWESSTETGSPGNNLLINNRSGFSALPSGFRDPTHGWNTFLGSGTSCGWWSSTKSGGSYALHASLDNHYPSLHTDDPNQLITILWSYGFSVRCLKNN